MQLLRFEAQKREVAGKGAARSLRRAGHIPAVLYGRKGEVISLRIDGRGFQHFLRSHGENAFIDLEVVDHGVETVMVKEIQRDPASHQLLHTDFMRISMKEPITSLVPIVLVGSAAGVQEGGVLEFPYRQLMIHCLPTLLPEDIEIDISQLEINDSIYVSDLSLAEDMEVISDPHTRVVAISPPKVETEAVEAEEEIEEEAETTADEGPEVISRKGDDEE